MSLLIDMLEFIGEYPSIKFFLPIALASLGGAIPLSIARKRRRAIERALPEMLESMAQTVGANQSVQEAFSGYAENSSGPLSELAQQAVNDARQTTFDSAIIQLAVNSRSSHVQRMTTILTTAIDQDAPLKDLLDRMAEGYARQNELMDQRESAMTGASVMMKIMVGVLLPAIIATVTGLFAPPASGINVAALNAAIATFLGAATGVSVAIGGRMLGRFNEVVWQVPMWTIISMMLYSVLYVGIGATMGGGI